MDAINQIRLDVWKTRPDLLEETARIDADVTQVSTTGACKEGMDISYDGTWGYNALVVSLANTQEPLFIANRSAGRPSHEGAPAYFDRAIALCRRAGFQKILLRGDTDFALTAHFDRWREAGVGFVFGLDARKALIDKANRDHIEEWAALELKADEAVKRRRRPERVKDDVVRRRGFKNIRLDSEDIVEFGHRPNTPRWASKHRAQRRRLFSMEFRTFLHAVIVVPAQVLHHGRRTPSCDSSTSRSNSCTSCASKRSRSPRQSRPGAR